MAADVIHRRVRREFRQLSVGWGTLRTITDAFESEGFSPGPESDESSQRRRLFDAYAEAIDWSDAEQADRALRVFEEVVSWIEPPEPSQLEQVYANLRRLLQRDGYGLSDEGLIYPVKTSTIPPLPLESLRNPASIREHLDRLDPSDPSLAIGASKSLIEATSKHVLEELGIDYDDRSDIPALVRDVQKALKAHPDTIAPTTIGRDTIVRILSNLSQVTVGIAALRNEYAPDHGRTRSSSGLSSRHAQLAIGTAHTYCRFLLDTLKHRQDRAN
ncbi:abortive infection family protein [Candidatus Poriferisodalis sp.]|uniref:abortive infection family protein n=1 Tax=Candidatus Poriferisodalis sp. TaxID=3101277 RepID=UPI003B5CA3FF